MFLFDNKIKKKKGTQRYRPSGAEAFAGGAPPPENGDFIFCT